MAFVEVASEEVASGKGGIQAGLIGNEGFLTKRKGKP